ncbi:MAG: DUF1266 domain-containing protein [Alphaproteobacteria bacterium]
MSKQANISAYKLFPWLNNKTGFKTNPLQASARFVLHGKNKEKQDLAQFYEQIGHGILFGRRQNWYLYHSFLQYFDKDEKKKLFKRWENQEDTEDWKIGVLKAYQLDKDINLVTKNQVMVGLAWDCFEAYERVVKAAKLKQISEKEAQSWAIIIAAMAMRSAPSYVDFIYALMRDLYWAYHLDDIDTSLLRKRLNNFINHGLTSHIITWDLSIFTDIQINGNIKRVLFSQGRNEPLEKISTFDDFTLNSPQPFDFLYSSKPFSVALNLLTTLNERPYIEYEEDYLTASHILWQEVSEEDQIHIFSNWLQNATNIESEQNLNDIYQMVMTQGQTTEMGGRLYHFNHLKKEEKQQLLELLKNELNEADDETKSRLQKEILQLEYANNHHHLGTLDKQCFSLCDWLDSLLIWRNAYLAKLVDIDHAKPKITDLCHLITKNAHGWSSLLEQIRCAYRFKMVDDMDDYGLKRAWLDILEAQPTGPVQNLSLPKVEKDVSSDTQKLLKTSQIFSTDTRLFKPSAKSWALNVAAPLIGTRQKLLTSDLASAHYRSENALFLRYSLNVSSHNELTEHLQWLQSQGRRYMLKELVQEYRAHDSEEIDKEIQKLIYMSGEEAVGELKYRIDQLEMIRENTEAVLQCQFWALDIIRYSTLIQRAVVANLIDEKEAWLHLNAAAAALQRRYNSWEDALWDFFRGWIFDAALATDNDGEIERRKGVVMSLLNPLKPASFAYKNLAWDMPLGMPELDIFNDDNTKDSLSYSNITSIPTVH